MDNLIRRTGDTLNKPQNNTSCCSGSLYTLLQMEFGLLGHSWVVGLSCYSSSSQSLLRDGIPVKIVTTGSSSSHIHLLPFTWKLSDLFQIGLISTNFFRQYSWKMLILLSQAFAGQLCSLHDHKVAEGTSSQWCPLSDLFKNLLFN
jgi:hypothetical protein